MSFIPYQNFTLVTHLTLEEIQASLNEVMEPPRSVRFFYFGTKRYEGVVKGDSFKIRQIRVKHHEQNFNPFISGRIYNSGSQTCIEIIAYVKFELVIAFWLFMPSLAVFLFSYPFFPKDPFRTNLFAAMLSPIYIVIGTLLTLIFLSYYVTMEIFNQKVADSKQFLLDLWQAQEE